MTLNDALKTIHKYSIHSLIVLVISSLPAIYLFNEYKSLQDSKDKHNNDIHGFYEKSASIEKEIMKKQKEIYQKEIYIEQVKKEYESKLHELSAFRKKLDDDYINNSTKEKELAATNQKYIISEKLQEKISDFSNLGIDLSSSPRCEDSNEKWEKYNKARAKRDEAEAYARANGLYDNYKEYFNSNRPFLVSSCG